MLNLHHNQLEILAGRAVMRGKQSRTSQLWVSTLLVPLFFLGWDAALGVRATHTVVGFLKGIRHRPTGTCDCHWLYW